ncbi:MAG: hypothetical protein ACR2OI_05370 [Acidimicrobiia bacterium]
MHQLRDKYQDRDVEFLAMYVREPHAGERGFPEYRNHEDFDHKMNVARQLEQLDEIDLTLGVDDMSQKQHETLGNLPNMSFVVDKQGKLVYSNTWQHAEDIDIALAQLVTADDPTRPVEPTINTRHLPGHM